MHESVSPAGDGKAGRTVGRRYGEAIRTTRYCHLLSLPGAWRLALAGALHRSSSFAIAFALTAALLGPLGYAKAGLASGLFIIGSAFGEPAQGRLCDRHGARGSLRFLTVLFTVLFAGLIAGMHVHLPVSVLWLICLICGAAMPFVRGPSRAAWWRIATSEEDRVTASAFEGTVGPAAYCAGYLMLAGGMVIGATTALLLAASSVIAGTLLLAGLTDERPAGSSAASSPPRRPWACLANRPLLAVLYINFAVFFAHGALQVSLLGHLHGHSGQTSLLLAAVLAATAVAGWQPIMKWRRARSQPTRVPRSMTRSPAGKPRSVPQAPRGWLGLRAHQARHQQPVCGTYHLFGDGELRLLAVWTGVRSNRRDFATQALLRLTAALTPHGSDTLGGAGMAEVPHAAHAPW